MSLLSTDLSALGFGSDRRVTSSLHEPRPADPRAAMQVLPRAVQPFLTWLTACPAPGEAYRGRTAHYHVVGAFVWLAAALTATGWALADRRWLLLPLGQILVAGALGKLQAMIYHHCAHNTVFRSPARNRLMGELISVLLLIKRFDQYQREHMRHHNPNKLLVEGDEYVDFITGLLGLRHGMTAECAWRRIAIAFVSPAFHARFLVARMKGCLATPDRRHNIVARAFWAGLLVATTVAHLWSFVALAWLVPVILLFQIATVLRTLCEHRFPDQAVVEARGKRFVCLATAGVFAGSPPPAPQAGPLASLLAWTGWWLKMLTLHLFERLLVLVGDAPAHDFHHRRPGSRKWPSYIHERARDRDAGCPDYPINYIENWGLFQAIHENLKSLEAARPPAADAGAP